MTVRHSDATSAARDAANVAADLWSTDAASASQSSRVDHIAVSAKARSTLSSGFAVSTCIIAGLEDLRCQVRLDHGRVLTMECGIYSLR